MMRIIEDVLPRVVFIENVPGFAGKGALAGMKAIEARLRKINKKHVESPTASPPHLLMRLILACLNIVGG